MSEQFVITMLGGFAVHRDNQALDLPPSCQRLVALTALKRRPIPRSFVCRTLWPTTRPEAASARLRTTLWRLRPLGAEALVTVTPQALVLAEEVRVDWYEAVDLIGQLLGHCSPGDLDHDVTSELLPLLSAGALLDGWTDTWTEHARATYRELRMDALDEIMSAYAQQSAQHR
ncbi:transcriptional regulator [Mycolicibacterium agri]|uniref:Transcriptional regulator n=1 Tax=Mycolicibacterium agri TaxID=36811 RepID=A0A2A7NEQ1_MYCAG|nr:transcriptional regulator [Mycolicibacterium agri]PEG42306.1 transcriptional regulator [Mycolicibacterium agri]GFG51157.1 transcriptional regulator [Mycolicibacterium agri]